MRTLCIRTYNFCSSVLPQLDRSFSRSTSQLLESENPDTVTGHNRQKHRQHLGKLLLSPPREITNHVLYYKTLHAQIILSGFQSNIFLTNILITAYSRGDALHSVVHLFAKMPERNLISWSSMISGYNQRGYYTEALALFREFMKSGGYIPNEFILSTVIQTCTLVGGVENGLHLHSFIVKAGYNQNAHVGSSLVDFYAKAGDLNAARLVFDELGVKNVVAWTAIIMGFSLNGRSDVSLDLFKEMVESGVVPDKYALSSALRACSILELLQVGKQVHGFVLRSGANIDVSVSNLLVDFYSKCGELKLGRKTFEHMVVKNSISWAMIISCYTQNGFDDEAISLYKEMNRLESKADGFACTSVLTSCGSVGALNHGKQVHAYTIKANLDSDDFVTNSLIDMYCKCDALIDARRAFLENSKHSAICYNAMIEGYSRCGSMFEALDVFNEMRRNLISPSVLTLVSLLGVSASEIALEVILQLHSLMIKLGFGLDSFGGSALIDVYSKCSFVVEARLVFEEVKNRDIVVWNSMLFGYAIQSENEEAFRLYLDLQRGVERPNGFTFVAMIMACSDRSSLLHAGQFHNQALKTGLDFNPFVANALTATYAKCGNKDSSELLFSHVLDRDIACWNTMISIHANYGDAEKALSTFHHMKSDGTKPDYITFVGVLSACAHAGRVEEAFCLFNSMLELGIEPGEEHYNCMVSLLGRAGALHEAKMLIEKMPIRPSVLVWKNLLSACRVNGDVELGEFVAQMAISSDTKDSGAYILLSNIFASKGMWSDVKMVRENMERNNVVKQTGYSGLVGGGEIRGDFSVN